MASRDLSRGPAGRAVSLTTSQLPTTTAGMRSTSTSLLSPADYDADAISLHSDRSEQDSDSDDDMLQQRARNSRELLAHDRLVFLEEDETDRLVTESRRKEDRERRGSSTGRFFQRVIRSSENLLLNGGQEEKDAKKTSFDDGHQEKRRQRKQRRKDKRQRLLERAEHGEDGELMFEMEEGGMKEGSSTGESSEREDDDDQDDDHSEAASGEDDEDIAEGDRPRDVRKRKRRSWLCWGMVHLVVVLVFALLLVGAWQMTVRQRRKKTAGPKRLVTKPAVLTSNGTALFGPTTLIISLDGFRADFLQRGLTPRLNAFVREGVSPPYMLPSFPSVTFPNHYTLATGLYPESHGIVGNSFWDPALKAEFFYTDPSRSLDPKWWGGEPFWVTAEKAGMRSAVHMWPGSEADVLETEPSIVDKFNGKEALDKKVARVLSFFDLPGFESDEEDPQRPQLVAAYVPNVDADGHRYGPNSTAIRTTIAAADHFLENIFQGLADRNLTDIVNVIVVSDHGMATTDTARLLQLEDLVDMTKIDHVDGWPLVGLRPKEDTDLEALHRDILAKTAQNPNLDVYRRDVDMPPRYHFSRNDRIAPLWIVPKTGWNIVQRDEFDVAEARAQSPPLVYHPRGLHGYDHEHPLMRAIFIARGPAFPHAPNSRLNVFQNIEVYNMLCDSVGLTPKPNNGTLRLPLTPAGFHEAPPDTPEDPVPPYSLKPSSTVESKTQSQTVQSKTVLTDSATSAPPTSAPTASTPTASTTEAPETTETSRPSPNNKNPLKHFWDWLTDKVDKAWHKITGEKTD